MNNMTNINVRVEKDVKEDSEKLFSRLGLNMTTAINMFLRKAIMENGIPFDIKLSEEPNEETRAAMAEAIKIANDPEAKEYKSIEEFMKAYNI